MSAYNFQTRFVGPIRSGSKWQTIRPVGKRRHAKPGERLQLYTGMRTLGCRKILDPDPICLSVSPIELRFFERCERLQKTHRIVRGIEARIYPRTNWAEIDDAFAIADGFDNAGAMARFFREQYGKDLPLVNDRTGMHSKSWSGLLIRWGRDA